MVCQSQVDETRNAGEGAAGLSSSSLPMLSARGVSFPHCDLQGGKSSSRPHRG
jgi:hypothetical protein